MKHLSYADLPLMGSYDVVVAGGGPAGCMAALAAARLGMRVLVVEQYGFLGGALTAQGVHPMMTFHAGAEQVIRGIPDELVQRLVQSGASPGHIADAIGYASSITPFDAEGLKVALEQMLAEAGVEVLFHAMLADADVDRGRIQELLVCTKSGLRRVQARIFVDGTGDGDLLYHTGAGRSPRHAHRHGRGTGCRRRGGTGCSARVQHGPGRHGATASGVAGARGLPGVAHCRADEKGTSMTTQLRRPNIVYFFVDDMGYGDASCLNPDGKIQTPNMDRLANEGMSFTDAHSSSAVCSPSRYSVLTGRYNWRSPLQKGIVGLYGNPLIAEDRLTVPAFLKQHGYHTACIGKWHLGQGWDFEADKDDFHPDIPRGGGKTWTSPDLVATPAQQERWQRAFSRPTRRGPTTRGFDTYFGVDVPNWPPYCFIENDHTVGIPSEFLPTRLLGNNLASTAGPAMPYWHFEQLLPTWAKKAEGYIKERAEADEPFFLYLPMTSPHTPLSVNKPWIGKSGLDNLYADLVMETDDVFGRILNSLERHGLADNTLVVFASDNGCAHYIGAKEMEAQGHFPSGPFRGYKSDAWDGGHRIPCFARWPGVIRPGSACDHLVCLSDLMATCADIVRGELPDDAGEDSLSMMPLFLERGASGRSTVVHHSIAGKFAIRNDRWKLVLCPGSGGWTHSDAEAARAGLPLVQLYDMQADPGETSNRHAERPDKVKELLALLRRYVDDGRSTPGVRQENDVPVDIWKLDTMPDVDPTMLDDY